MKAGKGKKKLVLNKVNIAQLGKDQINKIKSGEESPQTGLPTCQKIMSCTTTV